MDAPSSNNVDKATPLPAWYAEAQRLMGVAEAPGSANNGTIIGWAKSLDGWIASFFVADSIPWCGLFVAHCMRVALPAEPQPVNPLGALNWRTFGVPLTKPAIGAVQVFQRPGGGHVGFYAGEDAAAFVVLGGNAFDRCEKHAFTPRWLRDADPRRRRDWIEPASRKRPLAAIRSSASAWRPSVPWRHAPGRRDRIESGAGPCSSHS